MLNRTAVISNNYFIEFAVTDVESGERKASYPPKQVSFLSLQDFSAVKDASSDLLSQLGVNLTDRALQELKRAENTTRIQAENLLSRGITAQRQGSVADAFSYYFQAAALEPSLIEAVSRASVVSANISSGNIGQDVRNRLKVHDEWRIVINAAKTFYSSHLPYEFVYDTTINRGTINFDRRTTNLSIGLSLIPTEAWKTINDLKQGLSKARQPNESWNFNLNQIEPRQIVVILEILNQNNLILSRGTHTFNNPNNSTRLNATLNLQNVKADDLTDRLAVRVVSINDIPAQRAGETGFIQITTLASYNRRQEQIKAASLEDARKKREEEALAKKAREELEKKEQAKTSKYYAKYRDGFGWLSGFYEWESNGNKNKESNFPMLNFCFYWSPFAYTSLGLESRVVPDSEKDEINYANVSTTLGLMLPVNSWLQFFSDFVFEIGKFGEWHGLVGNWSTPAFDIGLMLPLCYIKYRGSWYKEGYTHSFDIGFYFKAGFLGNTRLFTTE
jgi:hypothetical protein